MQQASEGTGPSGAIDWEAIERSQDFQELVRKKRAFVVPRVIFFLAWYFGFVLLCGYAPDFMGERIYEEGRQGVRPARAPGCRAPAGRA
jgi:uncharacterized membrane protein (DUF485 family)